MKKILAMVLLVSVPLTYLTPPLAHASESQEITGEIHPTPNKQDVAFAGRSETAEKWFFKEIPRDLGLSMKESFWGWGALAFGLGAGLTAGLHPLDDDVESALGPNEIFSSTTNDVLGWTFSPYTIAGVSIILWTVGHTTKHPKLALTGRALSEALALSIGVTAIGKFAFRRTRPDGGNFSFPSAHATAAFSAAGVLTVFYGWKGALPSYAMASLVSLSRLDQHKHFLTDVVMGAVIGSVIGVGTAKFHKKENPNLFLVPSIHSEQATLSVYYRF